MPPTFDDLTLTERRVLALAQRGLTNQQIATELGISENGVRYHLKELHSKLGTSGDRALLRSRRWNVSALGVFFGQKAAGAGIAAGIGALSVAGYFAIQYAHESRADTSVETDSPAVYCVAELQPTPGTGEQSPGQSKGETCFETPQEVQAFYQSLP